MRRLAFLGALAVAVVAVAAALSSVYMVDQSHQAVVLRLGRPVAVINPVGVNDPGLRLKAPFIDTAVLLDKRSQALEADQTEVSARDQPALSVDGVMRFRIVDPLQFYRTLGEAHGAGGRLQDLLGSSLRSALSGATLQDIVGARRDQLASAARDEAARAARAAHLGVAVLDVRLLRTQLPPAATQAIYRRMQGALAAQAAQIRTKGDQQKRDLMAQADRDAALIRATASAQADRIRGDGEAKRAAILSAAYGRDPGFALFQRTMQAYQDALGRGDTTFVLSASSPFLKDFSAGPGAVPPR